MPAAAGSGIAEDEDAGDGSPRRFAIAHALLVRFCMSTLERCVERNLAGLTRYLGS